MSISTGLKCRIVVVAVAADARCHTLIFVCAVLFVQSSQWCKNQRFRQFNEPGHRAPKGRIWATKNFRHENNRPTSEKITTNCEERKCWFFGLCSVHAGFLIAGEVTWEHKTLVGWGTLLGKFTLLPRTGSRPSSKPQPHSQHFGLLGSALWPKQLRAPKLLLNQGLSEPCYATERSED